MKTYDEITVDQWEEELEVGKHWVLRHFFALIAMVGKPMNMLDIGCGLGETVIYANDIGVRAFGVDQLVREGWNTNFFLHHDLRNPFSLGQFVKELSVVDMVLCWEVAEHIPQDSLNVFCDTVANHVGRGGRLYWTSAHPGQGGTRHQSERPHKFWRDEFHRRGLNYKPEMSQQLALLWSNIGSPLWWLASNIQIYEK